MVSPALRALLERSIDYAGLFPPASLGCEEALANYRRYCVSEHAWMLGRFVVPAADLDAIAGDSGLEIAAVGETDDQRVAAIETKRVVRSEKPAYCEVPIAELELVKAAGTFAKIRTGGVTPDAIPTAETVAEHIEACADCELPFKATAGLHHAIRASHALTYRPDAPVETMHGFVNLLLAAAFAWHGDRDLLPVLSETDAAAFSFDERAHWRDRSLSREEVEAARRDFIHSFGSCSFEEPVADLRELGWL